MWKFSLLFSYTIWIYNNKIRVCSISRLTWRWNIVDSLWTILLRFSTPPPARRPNLVKLTDGKGQRVKRETVIQCTSWVFLVGAYVEVVTETKRETEGYSNKVACQSSTAISFVFLSWNASKGDPKRRRGWPCVCIHCVSITLFILHIHIPTRSWNNN